jgi:hypothetical protein
MSRSKRKRSVIVVETAPDIAAEASDLERTIAALCRLHVYDGSAFASVAAAHAYERLWAERTQGLGPEPDAVREKRKELIARGELRKGTN